MPDHQILSQLEWYDADGNLHTRRDVVDVPCQVAEYYEMRPQGHECDPSPSPEEPEPEPQPVAEEPEQPADEQPWYDDYYAAQDKAKELDIPANQSHEDLISAIEDALE